MTTPPTPDLTSFEPTVHFTSRLASCLALLELVPTDTSPGAVLEAGVIRAILVIAGPTTAERLSFADQIDDMIASQLLPDLARVIRTAALAGATPPVVRPHSHEPPTDDSPSPSPTV